MDQTQGLGTQWRRNVLEHGGQFGVRTIGRAVTHARPFGHAGGGCGMGSPPPAWGIGVLPPKKLFCFRCSYMHFGRAVLSLWGPMPNAYSPFHSPSGIPFPDLFCRLQFFQVLWGYGNSIFIRLSRWIMEHVETDGFKWGRLITLIYYSNGYKSK